MGGMLSFVLKAAASSAASGYAAHRLSSPLTLARPARISATSVATLAGLTYYVRVWLQGYYFDRSYDNDRDLVGRTAVVTGGTVGGVGYAAAEILHRQGATVIVTVRTKEKGEAAVAKLRGNAWFPADGGRASYVLCDFLSEASVRGCAAGIREKAGGGVDFLILNAGISGEADSKQKDGAGADEAKAARVWMTNHVGPWIFAQELMPSLIQAARQNPSEHPRAVWVSSGAHKQAAVDWDDPFHPRGNHRVPALSSYGQSKLANIMHSREYQKRVREALRKETEREDLDVKCFSLTPGAAWTNIFPKIRPLYPLFWAVTRSPTTGAQVIKMACLDDNLKGGEYLSNCCVKESEGIDGCSNDKELWRRLWELTERQVEEKEFEKLVGLPSGDEKTD